MKVEEEVGVHDIRSQFTPRVSHNHPPKINSFSTLLKTPHLISFKIWWKFSNLILAFPLSFPSLPSKISFSNPPCLIIWAFCFVFFQIGQQCSFSFLLIFQEFSSFVILFTHLIFNETFHSAWLKNRSDFTSCPIHNSSASSFYLFSKLFDKGLNFCFELNHLLNMI